MNTMKQFIKDTFAFNRSERNGIFVLLCLILGGIGFNLLQPFWRPVNDSGMDQFRKEIEAFEQARILNEDSAPPPWQRTAFDYNKPDQSAEVSHLTPFDFDPNQMGEGDWKRLGLTQRQIRMLTNYRSKGGTFRSRQDFRKMYCISAAEYEVLAPFILLPESPPRQEFANHGQQHEQKTGTKELLELNAATVEQLMELKGIGEYFAKKILAYRNALGGFIRKEQLLEVSKMDSSRYLQIEASVTVNPGAVRKINVNEADFDALKRHPYIGHNIALSLTNYRQQHGPFQRLEDIRKSALVTETVYKKIAPYLKI